MRNKKRVTVMILTALALTAAAVGCKLHKRKKEGDSDDSVIGCDSCCFGYGKCGVSDTDDNKTC